MCSAIFLRITDIGSTSIGSRRRRAARWRRRRVAPARRRGRAPATCAACSIDEAEDVVLGDAAADAGARNLRDVDVVLLRDLANERRRLLAAPRRRTAVRRCRRSELRPCAAGVGAGVRRAVGLRLSRRLRPASASATLVGRRGCGGRARRRRVALARPAPITATTLLTATVSPSLTGSR